MAAWIVHHDDVCVPQFRQQDLFDISQEGIPIDRTVKDHRCHHPGELQSSVKLRRLLMTVWYACTQFLIARRAPANAGHLGERPGFIDKDQAGRIEIKLVVEPDLHACQDVGSVLLHRRSGLF